MNAIQIREATVADIPQVERLILENFPPLFQMTMGQKPASVKHQVMVNLRLTRQDPVAGLLVADTDEGETIGTFAYELPGTYMGYSAGRLKALRPLGPIGAIRFVLLARLLFVTHPSKPGEVYIRSAATKPTYRQGGIASQFLTYAEEKARIAGCQVATTLIASTNAASLRIMQKFGYEEVGRFQHYWRGRLLNEPEMIYFQKSLWREPHA
jgi:ribosomal protein S18 acetylase RimI-like enzyme